MKLTYIVSQLSWENLSEEQNGRNYLEYMYNVYVFNVWGHLIFLFKDVHKDDYIAQKNHIVRHTIKAIVSNQKLS